MCWGAITNDVLLLDTSGLSLAYNSARVLGASQIAASGSTAFNIASSASGSVLSDYSFSGPTITPASASITPRALTSTASIGGALSKVYDGTTQATGATVSGNVLGAITNDVLNLDTSGLSLAYNSARVLGASQITASGSTAFTITSSASGSVLSDYSFSGPTITAASASITPRALTSAASIGGTLSKVYDGTTAATGATLSGNVLGAITNDVLNLDTSGLSLAYNSARVLGASQITASGSTAFTITSSASGSVLSDYSFSGPTITAASASITPRALTSAASIGGTLSKVYDGTLDGHGRNIERQRARRHHQRRVDPGHERLEPGLQQRSRAGGEPDRRQRQHGGSPSPAAPRAACSATTASAGPPSLRPAPASRRAL